MKQSKPPPWNLDLHFQSRRGRSFLAQQFVAYPYHITKPLYDDIQELNTPKLILQSLSGGIYQAEDLRHNIALDIGAKLDLRTQGSTIVHDTKDIHASSKFDIKVSENSSLCYIPEPQILFHGSEFTNSVRVNGVDQAAHVVIADSFLAYDPKSDLAETDFKFTTESSFGDRDGTVMATDKSIIHGQSHKRLMNGYRGYASFMLKGNNFDKTFAANCCQEIDSLEAVAAFSTLPTNAGWNIKVLAHDGVALSQVLDVVRTHCLKVIDDQEISEADAALSFTSKKSATSL